MSGKLSLLVLVLLAAELTSCKSKNEVLPVTGSINGVPAIPLYGNSNRPADFALLSTDSAVNELFYNGTVYNYTYISGSSGSIFITLSVSNIQRATLTKSSGITVLELQPDTLTVFESSVYTSR